MPAMRDNLGVEVTTMDHLSEAGFRDFNRPEVHTNSAWDLGRILGLGNLDGAWLLMRQGGPRLAIRTGGCLSVSALPPAFVHALPRGIFRAPDRPVFSGAFSTASHLPYSKNSMFVGLEFNLTILWSQSAKKAANKLSSKDNLDTTIGN
jgi:hypothetical protein